VAFWYSSGSSDALLVSLINRRPGNDERRAPLDALSGQESYFVLVPDGESAHFVSGNQKSV
jgi:hypothetical protein